MADTGGVRHSDSRLSTLQNCEIHDIYGVIAKYAKDSVIRIMRGKKKQKILHSQLANTAHILKLIFTL